MKLWQKLSTAKIKKLAKKNWFLKISKNVKAKKGFFVDYPIEEFKIFFTLELWRIYKNDWPKIVCKILINWLNNFEIQRIFLGEKLKAKKLPKFNAKNNTEINTAQMKQKVTTKLCK